MLKKISNVLFTAMLIFIIDKIFIIVIMPRLMGWFLRIGFTNNLFITEWNEGWFDNLIYRIIFSLLSSILIIFTFNKANTFFKKLIFYCFYILINSFPIIWYTNFSDLNNYILIVVFAIYTFFESIISISVIKNLKIN
jgi:hypothetical protein